MGYTKLAQTDSTANNMKTGLDMIRGGGILLLVIWLGMAAITMISFFYPRALRGEAQVSFYFIPEFGRVLTGNVKLVGGAVIALIALFIRILYTVLGAFITSASFNPRTGGTTAEKILLDILPEFILTVALVTAGIASRNLRYERESPERQGPGNQEKHRA